MISGVVTFLYDRFFALDMYGQLSSHVVCYL